MDIATGNLHYLELTEIAACIRTRQISPPEVTRALLDRIAAVDGKLGSYVRVMADAALAPFFAGTNMVPRRRHRAGFVAEATGGPAYRGRELGAAHAHLGIRRRGPEPSLKVGLWRDPSVTAASGRT